MRPRADRRKQAVWWGLSAIVVASMLCSLVLLVQPAPPQPTPAPLPTATAPAPTAAPTPGQPAPAAGGGGAGPEFTFAVAGDSRSGPAVFTEILRRVSAERPAFLVHTGDLVDRGTPEEFADFRPLVADLAVPFHPVPGNHDASGGSLDAYLQYSGAPALHYSFDHGQAHIACADSHAGYLSAEEMAWLDADLAATSQPLKIVVLHYPPFDPNGGTHVMTQGNEAFMQLMEARGVRYVLAGHIHAYAAGARNGVTYVISGGAGAPPYGTEAQGGYYHYLRVHVKGAELTYEVVRVQPASSLAPRLAYAPAYGLR